MDKENEKKIGKMLMVCISVFFLIGITVRPASAEIALETLPDSKSYNDFVVGPGKTEIDLEPGETRTVNITVANRLGSDKLFTLGIEDFVGSDDPTRTVVLLGDDRGPYSLRDYIKPATTTILIPQGIRARIPVVISVPKDAQPGGLYGSIVVGTVSRPGDQGIDSGTVPVSPIITRIGSLFFIRVKGEVLAEGQLTKFALAGKSLILFGSPKVTFDLLYKNSGNVHLDPSGTITVSNILGSNVGDIEVEPWFAMPNSLRFRQVEWTPPFLFGRYVAHASIDRGYDKMTDDMELVFWVIPTKIILVSLAVIIIFILLIKFLMNRFSIVSKK